MSGNPDLVKTTQCGHITLQKQCKMSKSYLGGFILFQKKIHEITSLQLYIQLCDQTNMLPLHLFQY
jgi:hypothetical protein